MSRLIKVLDNRSYVRFMQLETGLLLAKTRYFYLSVSILGGNANEIYYCNFMNSLLTDLIPPKIQSWPKFLA